MKMDTQEKSQPRQGEISGQNQSPGEPKDRDWFFNPKKEKLICPKCDYSEYDGMACIKEHLAFHFPMLLYRVPNTLVLGGNGFKGANFVVAYPGNNLEETIWNCIDLLAS
jgi:hypothetical protein